MTKKTTPASDEKVFVTCQTCGGSGDYKSGLHHVACPTCGGEGAPRVKASRVGFTAASDYRRCILFMTDKLMHLRPHSKARINQDLAIEAAYDECFDRFGVDLRSE